MKKQAKLKQRRASKLTEETIERHVGEQSFRRGQGYFRSNMIFDCRRVDTQLKGRCYGQSADSYRLSARVGGNRILEAECSCPVGDRGYCKHVAALLLTWLHTPDEFLKIEPLEKRLADCSKSKLIKLIEQMVEQEPDLESWLELALPTALSSHVVVNPDDYRRQTVAAFSRAGHGYEADDELTAALESLSSIGDEFCQQERFESAAAVYSGILDGFCAEYETFHDGEGEAASAACQCIPPLAGCLSHLAEGSEARNAAVRSLFEMLRLDINLGGIGLSDDVFDILLDQTTSAERAMIAGWIRDTLPNKEGFSSEWRRRTWGGLLLDFEGEPADDEAFLQHCREFGLTDALVERLLERGRLDDALKEIAAASDYELVQHADRLVVHKHAALAHDLVQKRLSKNEARNNGHLQEWLKKFYASQKNPQAILDICLEEFRDDPSLHSYQEIRAHAKKLKTWKSLRPEVMSSIPKDSRERIRIHLDEGEVAEAIEVFNARPSERGFALGWDRIDLEVAEAAEKSHPETALQIYRAEAERLIDVRGRANYRTACRHLQKLRQLLKQVERGDEWQEYISSLRKENRSLRAFLNELKLARLS
ncbi:MAG: SWIM zinc finger family protein [Maioricimonas sp. JB049]